MIQIQVNNNTYKSISAAWRELSPPDLPMITVRWRLKSGWEPYAAFLTPAVPPKRRRVFKGIRKVYYK